MVVWQSSGPGVLPDHLLEKAIAAEVITGVNDSIPPANVQPASLDLRLGDVAHRIRCSFLPGDRTVNQRLEELTTNELPLTGDGAVLEVGIPYIIPLIERLKLPANMRARANPKSSTGRADVFTRVLTDAGARFDDVRPGYSGPLFVEVVPLSFPVRVRRGLALNQLRLSVGNTSLSDAEIRKEHAEHGLLSINGKPLGAGQLQLAAGLFVGLNLRQTKAQGIGWQARKPAPLLDLTRTRHADPKHFWDRVEREEGNRIILLPNSFYLLMSQQGITIPPHLAAEMAAYDPTSGELRTHYAGFFDPGFGYGGPNTRRGSTAALEVRAHDVPFMVEHGQHVCKLTYERMMEPPSTLYGGTGSTSNYQGQTETLGKHFRVGPPQLQEPLSEGDEPLDLTHGVS
ncbi:2'-deoxycytidine 5'-triphosphate deaminase [Marmoricola sp. Leaf446]|uniref:2'-deoxycytidine 5'-triphosphate deaminase n=1 Tax=Marmoricola sp. Leaf446 TaxID=1736379 RepID=UPI0009E8ED56|nr:2'-deoxycytidine 5'-triphosphate deaminase [Marmoricola sp. Leaf446]